MLWIKVKELARDDLAPILQTGVTVHYPAKGVRPSEDKFVGAQSRRIGKDGGRIKCAVFNSLEIVEYSSCDARIIESKSQRSNPFVVVVRRAL
ncbi:hypothetical protein I6F26_00465 [Ensifer sp. IC3342]|nr:hypothetical protein [Ensifer sp. BRP08]MCA1445066.1 hypothetical protein [Ensifer sp. IC3342]